MRESSMLLPRPGILNHRQFAALLAIAGGALVPFGVMHLLAGEAILFTLSLFGIAMMASLLVWVMWRETISAPALILLIGSAFCVLASMLLQGAPAVFWAFPLVLVNYLILALRPAIISNALFAVALVPVTLHALPFDLATRVLVTLALVSVFTCVFSHAVHRSFARMDRLAQIDALTGVWNRRHLHARLPEPCNWLTRDGVTSSILVLDVDHFKTVNDHHGHAAGDRLLKALGDLLEERTRDRDLVFRYGGEEFVLILPNTSEASAVRLAEDLRTRIGQMEHAGDMRMTISVGVAELRAGEDEQAWLERADAALYAAKNAGRDRVVAASSIAE